MMELFGALIAWGKEQIAKREQEKLCQGAEFWCDKEPYGCTRCREQCALCAEALH